MALETRAWLYPLPVSASRPLLLLLASNLLTIVLALVQHWDVAVLMWIYWGQSLVIGYYNVHRILGLERFSTRGFRINHRPVAPTRRTQRQTAGFFTLHYGLFHLFYGLFMVNDAALGNDVSLFMVMVCIVAFWLNHGYSYRHTRARDRERVPNIGSIMFFPYLRIVPMHLMILFGHAFMDNGPLALLFFLLLKTAADAAMHVVGHAGR